MIALAVFAFALSGLDSEDCYTRDVCEAVLSCPAGARYVRSLPASTSPEVRLRAHRILKYAPPALSPADIELKVYKANFRWWFWEYAFEDCSLLVSDNTIRAMFVKSTPDIEAVFQKLRGLDNPYGNLYFLQGNPWGDEARKMRIFFDHNSKTGQAKRALVGGMFNSQR